MNLRNEYRTIVRTEENDEEMKTLFAELDDDVIEAMAAQGYDTEEIISALMKRSMAIHNRPLAFAKDYVQRHVPHDLVKGTPVLAPEDAYDKAKAAALPKYEEKFRKRDAAAMAELLNRGESVEDVLAAARKENLYYDFVSDHKINKKYLDSLWHSVHQSRKELAGMDFDAAASAYQLAVQTERNKYANRPFDRYCEGAVVIPLVRKGFHRDVMERVLWAFSPYPDKSGEYIDSILDRAEKIKHIYAEIDENQLERATDAKSPKDVYNMYAKRYLAMTGGKSINFHADEAIAREMLKDSSIGQDSIGTILKASPFAIHPGRNTEQYAQLVLDAAVQQESKREAASQAIAVNAYQQAMDKIHSRLLAKGYHEGVNRNRSYFDTVVAHELLLMQLPANAIVKAVAEASPLAKTDQNLIHSTGNDYASWVVGSARHTLLTENQILHASLPKISKGMSYKDLISSGHKPYDIYCAVVQSRVKETPSFVRKMFSNSFTKDVTESLLTKYPDFDQKELYTIIRKSPRCLMAGISADYPDEVFTEVQQRIAENKRYDELQKQEFDRLKNEYNKKRGIAAQAAGKKDSMASLIDGKAAIDMLIRLIPAKDIAELIIATSAVVGADSLYASGVVQQAQVAVHRFRDTCAYQVPDGPSQDVVDDYRRRLKEAYSTNPPEFSSRHDIAIMEDMKLEGKYPPEDIREAVQTYSPVAAEPGRDEAYCEFVEQKADAEIAAAKEKLELHRPVPRQEHEKDPAKEYAYHQKYIRENTTLPYDSSMDRIIAETMLAQGFEAGIVAQMLSSKSPVADRDMNYGNRIIASFVKNFESVKGNNLEKQKVHSLVRERTTSTQTNWSSTTFDN